MSSGEEREEGHVDPDIPEGRVLPLNSRRLVAGVIVHSLDENVWFASTI